MGNKREVLGRKLIGWYNINSRKLPWRETKNPYNIWISEIVLQQTQVKQGLQHYLNFIARFPDVETLANAETDEVLLYWKGLGYYSRALNLHKAAIQVRDEFGGEFPESFNEIIKLKGVGKYTAAAIASICFNERIPAVDGNFYRVLSRLFADGFDVSKPQAFQYFSELALSIMPKDHPGDFNQAVMDLGSQVCKPKTPECNICPLNDDCASFQLGKVQNYPVKTKKIKIESLSLHYCFVQFEDKFLIRRRGNDFIWKNLYEFPTSVSDGWEKFLVNSKVINHKLTHRNLSIQIDAYQVPDGQLFQDFAENHAFLIVDVVASHQKSFPKPLENYIAKRF